MLLRRGLQEKDRKKTPNKVATISTFTLGTAYNTVKENTNAALFEPHFKLYLPTNIFPIHSPIFYLPKREAIKLNTITQVL